MGSLKKGSREPQHHQKNLSHCSSEMQQTKAREIARTVNQRGLRPFHGNVLQQTKGAVTSQSRLNRTASLVPTPELWKSNKLNLALWENKIHWPYLKSVRCFSQVDSILRKFIPYQHFELQFRISYKVIAIGHPWIVVSRAGGLVRSISSWTWPCCPGVITPVWARVLVAGGRNQWLQRKIVATRLTLVTISELEYRCKQPVSVIFNVDPYGIQVWLPDLLANFQVIIAIVDEWLHILGQVELGQPLEDKVWP